ncbi:MAG: clostripain-related cysteine peptidase [Nitrospirota bacterium]
MFKKVSVILGVVALGWFMAVSRVNASIPPAHIDISTNQASYNIGDTLIEGVHLWNNTNQTQVVDIKNWVECPAPGGLISIYNLPAFQLPANFNFQGNIFQYTFGGVEPQGNYKLGARLLNNITGDNLSEDFVPFTFGTMAKKEWTYLVYIAADNDLEDAGIEDFLEMAQVGSSDNVNIVVQFDRIPGYDSQYGNWTSTKRFHIQQDMTPTPANALADIGEADMGDDQTLKDFVEWAMINYPANKYALVLWNHGGGILKKLGQEQAIKTVCIDVTNNSYLHYDEVETALSGKMMNLLGYDACLMGMIEVAYETKASSEVLAASQEVEPWDGWPYDTILTDLVNNPGMDATFLGSITVKHYIDSYLGVEPFVTFSAVNTTLALDNLATAVSNFAMAMIACGEWANIKAARLATEDVGYPDLYDFGEEIYNRVTSPVVKSAVLALGNAINNDVIAEAHYSGHPGAHGISIYFPTTGSSPDYANTNFAVDTQWNEFLNAYDVHTK